MHPSLLRLLNHTRQMTAHLPESRRITEPGDLVQPLDITHQVLTNWKDRGVSKDGALRAEAVFGCPAVWVLDAKTPLQDGAGHWAEAQHSDEGETSPFVSAVSAGETVRCV